ncbi:MAG: radical SAM protein [bacterium]
MSKVGYLTFGRDDFGFGLSLCLSELTQSEIYRVTPKTARIVDWLVFSCFWWEHIYVLADFLRRAGISKKQAVRPRIVVGGFNTVNPLPFLAYADYVAVGDGEGVLRSLIETEGNVPTNVLHDSHLRASYGTVPELKPWCHETNEIARIEIARGCKFPCTFCAVSHLKRYRELPLEGVRAALQTTKLKRVSLFAPEPTIHSQDEKITVIAHNMGKIRVDSDVRLDRLEKRKDSVPRVGVEGLSERLRKSVKKPYSNERILESVRKAIADGRRGMFWYLILDLPGETDEDFREFEGLLRQVGEIPGAKNFILKPSPSVFLPTPFTPMQHESIHWDRDYARIWREFFGRGEDRDWDVIMAERSRVFSPGMRLLSMISTRAGEEFAEIENEAARSGAIAVSAGRPVVRNLDALVCILARNGGPERYTGQLTRGVWEDTVLVPDARNRQSAAGGGSAGTDARTVLADQAANLVA